MRATRANRWMAAVVLAALLAGSAAGAAPATPRRAVAAPPAAARATPKATAKPAAKPGGPRRLEDVRIEGEVPVPQVLFVTARDQRRVVEFQHHRYLRTSRELAAATPQPAYVALPQNPPPPR